MSRLLNHALSQPCEVNELSDRYQQGHNPSCGDTVELTIKLSEAGDIIEELKFEGKGCAISIASADLMAENLQGKSVAQALSMVQQFRDMMKGQI